MRKVEHKKGGFADFFIKGESGTKSRDYRKLQMLAFVKAESGQKRAKGETAHGGP